MKRGTEKVGTQMCLPLEEWLEKERGGRSNAMRPIGEIAASVVRKVGRSTMLEGSGGEQRTGPIRGGEEESPRKETEGKRTGPEGPVSSAGAASDSGETIVDFLHSTMLRRHAHSGRVMAVVVLCECLDSEPVHHAGSETWIEF